TKGRLVYIEGSLQTREWDDQEGNKRKTTEIRARDMVLLGSPAENAGGVQRRTADVAAGASPAAAAAPSSTITDDDIPFEYGRRPLLALLRKGRESRKFAYLRRRCAGR